MNITRVYANANRWTFKIPSINRLISKYVGDGSGWVDPFAGMYSPAEHTNDLRPSTNAKFHMDAIEFCEKLQDKYNGILFDPPYSPRQMKECYNDCGIKPTMQQTQNITLYYGVKKVVANKIKLGGLAISFGWNSYGWGKRFGFEPIEIMLVCHSSAHNDTIVVVEKKLFEP